MAVIKTEYHICDLCATKIERPYHGGLKGTYKLEILIDHGTTGYSIRCKELCKNCNNFLKKIKDQVENYAKLSRELKG